VALNAKAGYAKNGLLKQIIYPTGGTLSFEYEQNTGVLGGASQNVGGVHVSKVASTDGTTGNNNCNNPIITQYNYVTGSGSSSLWGLEMPVNAVSSMTHYQPEYKVYKYKLSCIPFGCCDWKWKYPGIMSMNQYKNLSDGQKFLNVVSSVMSVISAISTIQNILLILSSQGNVVALLIDMAVSLINLGITCIGNQAKDTWTNVYFNSDLTGAAPLPTQFKRVEVIEGSGGIGKTIQEFTSDEDYALWHNTNPVFTQKQRFAPWAYGLPTKTQVYNVSGHLIKETINQYTLGDSCSTAQSIAQPEQNLAAPPTNCYPMAKKPLNIFSAKNMIIKSSSIRDVRWFDPAFYNSEPYLTTSSSDMWVDVYDMYTGRTELKKSIEREYKAGTTEYVESVTEYTYNTNNNYEVNKITTTQSNGDVNYKYLKYSSDFGFYAPVSTMVANNMVSIPVSTITSVKKNGSSFQVYLGEKVTEFVQLGNGDIKPLRVIEQRFCQPVSSMTFYSGPGNNASAYKIKQSFTYDAAGNLTGLTDEGNRSICNIYDYDDKYIAANIINANPATDKRAYTSFETASFGEWFFSGTASYNTTTAITGNRSMNLGGGSFLRMKPIPTGKTHVVSFWATTSTITVSGGALKKSGPTYNGFTYYEYEIASTTTTSIVSGTGTIDELRFYPSAARMRSFTFDPVIGKTSDCDENNRITYYEYDKLRRLWMIKDEKKNIVKVYEYNNISAAKQNGCPGVYYNKLISELFTKECAPGYQGEEVRFTVNANTFSSTLSQEDAEAKAEIYLLEQGQLFANNNGGCSLIYYNAALSRTDTTDNCPAGYIGGLVTYTVPAGRYTSIISQADADEQALDDIEANIYWYVNSSGNAVCTINTDPLWEWVESGDSYCQTVNGQQHLFVLETDVNPNSASYGQTRWWDTGPSDLCTGGSTYYNTLQSQSFIKNDCPPGYTGSTVTYTVPAGTYSSTVSQAAADQQALNNIAANGQNYANINGTCTQNSCDPGACTAQGLQYQCINNNCEAGIRVNTETYWTGMFWACVYHYEFSDGSWSTTYTEYNSYPCDINQ
jgi:Family of unknown function (DUF5977)